MSSRDRARGLRDEEITIHHCDWTTARLPFSMNDFFTFFRVAMVISWTSSMAMAEDPCINALGIDDSWRDVAQGPRQAEYCDADGARFSSDIWYYFTITAEPASIPTKCIKNNMCGGQVPFSINLEGKLLPDQLGDRIEAIMCGSYNVLGKYECCLLRVPVTIHLCPDRRLIYRFLNLTNFDRCPVTICAQKLDAGELPLDVTAKMGDVYIDQLRTEREDEGDGDTIGMGNKETGQPLLLYDEMTTEVLPTDENPRTDDQTDNTGSDSISGGTTEAEEIETTADVFVTSWGPLTLILRSSNENDSYALDTHSVKPDTEGEATTPIIATEDHDMSNESGATSMDPGKDVVSSGTLSTEHARSAIETTTTETESTDLYTNDTRELLTSSSVTLVFVTSPSTPNETVSTSTQTETTLTRAGGLTAAEITSATTAAELTTPITSRAPITLTTTTSITTTEAAATTTITPSTRSIVQNSTVDVRTPPPTSVTLSTLSSETFRSTNTMILVTSSPSSSSSLSKSSVISSTDITSIPLSHPTNMSSKPVSPSRIPATSRTTSFDDGGGDLIITERIRIVFKDVNKTEELTETISSVLSHFLRRARITTQGEMVWWYSVMPISTPQTQDNLTTFTDYEIQHSYSDDIFNLFSRYQLKKFFLEESGLKLLAYCRRGDQCQVGALPSQSQSQQEQSVLQKHLPVLIAVLSICALCMCVMVLGFLCARYRRKGKYYAKTDLETKQLSGNDQNTSSPAANQSPFTDAQIMKDEHGADDMSFNGSARDGDNSHVTAADDSWVVPLEEVTLQDGSAMRTEDTQF